MSAPRKAKKTADDRLRDQLAAAKSTLETKDRIIAAQQSEIEAAREFVAQLTAPKPGRPFRARKIIHGPLDITIKGTDVSESEVVIEHVGGFLAVRIGDAIGSTTGMQREAYRFTPTPGPAPAATSTLGLPAAPQENLMMAGLREVGINNIADVDPMGMTASDPTIINAKLAPQADPRFPGGHLQNAEAGTVAAKQFGGWSGVGPRPAGWEDPDEPKPETAH